MTIVDTSKESNANKTSSSLVAEEVNSIEEGAQALMAAVEIPVDNENDDDDASTASNVDLRKLIHAEVAPPKSLVLIWVLMAAELGFDLITTAIALVSTVGATRCCKQTVHMGPLPMTTSIPFFFLIVAEITFLVRAILLTLWPSVFETTRVAAHETDDECVEDDQIGFEIGLAKTRSESITDGDETNSSDGDTDGENDGNDTEQTSVSTNKNDSAAEEKDMKENEPRIRTGPDPKYIRSENDPEYVKTTKTQRKYGCLKRACRWFLKWNARMVLVILNLLTLANPFFGCLIAYILLHQSDKRESFVVLGIESLSIFLHFVSVRMEGGLRTWWSKLLHSVALLPFLVTVILVLVFLREGGMCYTVESKLFRFSGCEVCPDTLAPPINGMCGSSALEGIGGFREEFRTIGSSFDSFGNLKNIASIAERGAEQGGYCSDTVNFCFFEF